jgi:hypothetical protein
VRGLLSSLTSMLPDWKGPADVDERILRESGRLVMRGFEAGLTDQFDSVRRTLSGLTGDLPTFTAPPGSAGTPRGGDGASTVINVTLQPGAIQVTGQGAEAGEQAAEALLQALANAQD